MPTSSKLKPEDVNSYFGKVTYYFTVSKGKTGFKTKGIG